MESGSLQQRNVVGVITGLMGSGKTTLLYHLFGEPPPDLYTSTGVAEQSFRGLLHHTLHLSARTWQRLSHKDIRELLAPLIRAGMRKAAVDYLASRLMHDLNPTATTSHCSHQPARPCTKFHLSHCICSVRDRNFSLSH